MEAIRWLSTSDLLRMNYKTPIIASLVLAAGQIAFGQSVPSLINYQGRLTDQTGAPLPIGNYGIEFRIWDSPTSTASGLIWGQRQNVSIQASGVFNVIIGAAGGS